MSHADLTFSHTTASPVLVPQAIGAVEAMFTAVGRLTQSAIRYRTVVGHVMEGVPKEVANEVAQRYDDLSLGERLPLADVAAWPLLRRLQWAGWVVGLRLAEEAGERTAGPASVAPWPAPPARTT